MKRFKKIVSLITRPLPWGATILAAGLAVPALAKDQVHTCVANPGAQETATFVFHPKLFGVDSDEGDGDVFTDDFEHQFTYWIRVNEYDPARPDWTGPNLCDVFSGWQISWDMPNLRYQFMEQNPGGIIYLKNVPRFSRISLNFSAKEMDGGSDDHLDFDPSPNTTGSLGLTVLVDEMKVQTMVGERAGQWDVDLNRAKRVIGDGKNKLAGDKVRAFLEFVVNLHVDQPKSDQDFTNVLPAPDPLVPITGAVVTYEPLCRDYAEKAVLLNAEAQKLGCGFAAPVWSNDEEGHFKWCMHGGNASRAGKDNIKRAVDLNACAIQKAAALKPEMAVCVVYANEAVKMVVAANALQCGFTGPRWDASNLAHYQWCSSGVDQGALLIESLARSAQFDACQKSKSP
ncbi:MAG: hypothetical protein AB8B82_09285 [Roseovarius sp.]